MNRPFFTSHLKTPHAERPRLSFSTGRFDVHLFYDGPEGLLARFCFFCFGSILLRSGIDLPRLRRTLRLSPSCRGQCIELATALWVRLLFLFLSRCPPLTSLTGHSSACCDFMGISLLLFDSLRAGFSVYFCSGTAEGLLTEMSSRPLEPASSPPCQALKVRRASEN